MPIIHSSACVDASARIADDVTIGPFCVVGPDASIAAGCSLISHVHVTGHTTIGERTRIFPFSSIGTAPQSLRHRGGPTRLVIGAQCTIRENVTMNPGTEDGGGITEVGDRCLVMAGSHVAHDCRVGSDVILANNAVLGGHVVVGNHALLGGLVAIHQFVRIGEGAMIAGFSGASTDVIPFGLAIGQRAVLAGLNVIGLRRRGVSREDLHRLRSVYNALFFGEGLFNDRLAAAERDFGEDPRVAILIAFIRDGKSRPLMAPSSVASADDDTSPDAMP